MTIGDELMKEPTIWLKSGLEVTGPQRCRVVYIHPEKRFYRVQFTALNGAVFHECYYFKAQPMPEQPQSGWHHLQRAPRKVGRGLYG